MTDSYRDELEAAQARADELQRDIERLRRRNAELEHRPEAVPAAPVDEATLNRERLLAAVRREREEAAARAHARYDEEQLRALSRPRPSGLKEFRRDQRQIAIPTITVVGAIAAAATGTFAGVVAAIVLFAVALALVRLPGEKPT